MCASINFTREQESELRRSGKDPARIQEQLKRFETGFSPLHIVRAATRGQGIMQISQEQIPELIQHADNLRMDGRLMKFVPASGAATRMFGHLEYTLAELEGKPPGEQTGLLEGSTPETRMTREFLNRLHEFAFYGDLQRLLAQKRLDPSTLLAQGEYATVLSAVLNKETGLGLSALPKALIAFHAYEGFVRTPLEEHVQEALATTRDRNGVVRMHCTISAEHEQAFIAQVSAIRKRMESDDTSLDITWSFQKPETDTIAVDENNRPFVTDEGELLFRPGGHGALLANLQELQGDLVYVKNIDNVAPARLCEPVLLYKKILAGLLGQIQQQVFAWMKQLEDAPASLELYNKVRTFMQQMFLKTLPEAATIPDGEAGMKRVLLHHLDRPLRVCGMVENKGEPGGGPFLVRDADGSVSLQIVESAQIDTQNPEQKAILESSTHFNPVDLVCSLRNHCGEPYELEQFRDPETGFISHKSHQGRALKALELPGLWNGSMARWNTVFVEVPARTFSPVKTVNDLLRDEHQGQPVE